jgi:hypothetical protein
VVFRDDDDRASGFRSILVDDSGRAFVAAEDSRLLRYDPGADALANDAPRLPDGWLRASTAPAANGTVYGVTTEPEVFFALRPDGSVEKLGGARGYTTSLVLDAQRHRVLSVPGAHGDAFREGAPILALDTETGDDEVLVDLNDLAEEHLDLTLGGSYNIALDPRTDTLYVGFNAGLSRNDPWGEVVLVIVHLT